MFTGFGSCWIFITVGKRSIEFSFCLPATLLNCPNFPENAVVINLNVNMPTNFEQSQKKEFDRFFQNLGIPDNRALQIEFETLLQFMGNLAGKRVLDLGCGIGRNGIKLAQYAGEVVGYDISDVAVAKANEFAKQLGVGNFRAELNNFSDVEKEGFDVILCVNMLHHSSSPLQVLGSINRALRPGGQLIIMENNPLNPLFPIFFMMIGQLKAHFTKQFLMVNRFTLAKLIATSNMTIASIERHGFLPTFLYNHSLLFKSFNESINRIPLLNELTAFYLIKAVKNDILEENAVSTSD